MRYLPAPRRLAIATRALLLAALAASFLAAPTSAAPTATDAEAMIVGWVNTARASRGLSPLRTEADLGAIAGLRASRMASANVMNHTVGGNLAAQLKWYGVGWYRYGEAVGWSSAAWTTSSARALYVSWMNSTPHRALLMSSRFNYIGVGLAYRSSNKRTYGSTVLSESPDHTRPVARVKSASRSGDDVRWTWNGYDPKLQTHSAGLRDYDVQYRVGSGSWVMLRDNTTSTALTLANRAGGKSYSIRVRATDRRGNLSAWSSESRVGVP
ncbi:MAG: CAP domain-containing protein [Candidatus Limnocylindrales bacterium]